MLAVKSRIISVVMAVLMLISLIPAGLVEAATTSNNQYFIFSTITNASDIGTPSASNVLQVNQSTWTVTATFSGNINPSSIYYTVNQVPAPQNATPIKGTNPSITPGTQVATFQNVQLFSGLNEITFYGTRTDTNTVVSSIGYVYNINSPVISSVAINSQELSSSTPTVVTSPYFAITVTAPNATTVQAYQTFGNAQPVQYSGTATSNNQFIISGINFNNTTGQYDFKIVASNQTQAVSAERQIVYYPNQPTFYNVTATQSGSAGAQSLEANPSLTTNAITSINGNVLLDDQTFNLTNNSANFPTVTAQVYDSSSTPVASAAFSYSNASDNGQYTNYTISASSFTGTDTSGGQLTLGSGSYQVKFFVNNVAYQTLPFSVLDPNAFYMQSLKQLTGVTGDLANTATASGTAQDSSGTTTDIANNTVSMVQLPFYLNAQIGTLNGGTLQSADIKNLIVKINQNGTWTTLTMDQDYKLDIMSDGTLGVRFNTLPSGTYQIGFWYNDGTNPVYSLGAPLTVTSQVVPYIQISGLTDQQGFTNAPLQNISGQLINFQDVKDANLKVTINGAPVAVNESTDSSGNFNGSFTIPSLGLQPGTNEFLVTANSNGNIPVQLKYTLYLNMPSQIGFGAPGDPNVNKYIQVTAYDQNGNTTTVTNTSGFSYTTSGSKVTVTGKFFGVNDPSHVSISVGGTALNASQYTVDTNAGTFTIPNYVLVAGTTSFTITINDPTSGNTDTLNILVVQVKDPFTVIYPLDFQTNQVYTTNSNFFDVVIQTSTADSVVIGKVNAVPYNTDTTFGTTEYGAEVPNLKIGVNAIPIQITRGSNTTKGTISVNYVAQNVPGARYKGLLTTSGKWSAFNGEFQLQFPRNTVFQPQTGGFGLAQGYQPLLDNQQIFAGIADRKNGDISQIVLNDGTIIPFQPVQTTTFSNGVSNIPLDLGENYASDLIWVDAGDYALQSSIQNSTSGITTPSFIPDGGLDPSGVLNPFDIIASTNNPNLTVDNYNSRIGDTTHWLEPTNQGSITLKYDPNIRNMATTDLTILYLDHNTGKWDKIGGIVNTGSHTITAPFKGFGYYVVALVNSQLQDVAGITDINNLWAKPYVETMIAKGIMNPETSTSFGAFDPITRGEFAEVLVKALGLPLNYDQNNTFSDVGYSEYQPAGQMWEYKYIETAARAGIIHGIGNGAFDPNGPIQRQDAAVMIARAANYPMSIDPTASVAALQKAFTDAGSINAYAAPAILAVYKKGIITGNPNPVVGKQKPTYYFNPNGNLLRAETAVIATKLMQQLRLLPSKL
ncbi:S-layer homology domain-containing protein [Fodinisporobacter ferrooxydans]|uniref:S-layer homology domain-containing protein n=1 Tax=Fodinisporobacter ferrooxydans TaxID=2901836 RepID=A0ABY4CLR7_9BACL|nr:S-layer homology domain-containing protein [Alicyclobacillaceae bacterium MYW30-H2]